jgi:hypothetical protein
MRRFTLTAAALAVALTASGADAKSAPGHDANGKFIECAAGAAPAGPCRDKTTKEFAKRPAPNAELVSNSK